MVSFPGRWLRQPETHSLSSGVCLSLQAFGRSWAGVVHRLVYPSRCGEEKLRILCGRTRIMMKATLACGGVAGPADDLPHGQPGPG